MNECVYDENLLIGDEEPKQHQAMIKEGTNEEFIITFVTEKKKK